MQIFQMENVGHQGKYRDRSMNKIGFFCCMRIEICNLQKMNEVET